MTCPNCGANIPDGSAFCSNCGKPVNANVQQPKYFCRNCGAQLNANTGLCDNCKAAQNYTAPNFTAQNYTQQNYNTQNYTAPNNVFVPSTPASGQKSKAPIVAICCIIGVIVVALIVGIIFFVVKPFEKPQENIVNIPQVETPAISSATETDADASKAIAEYVKSLKITETTAPYIATPDGYFSTTPDSSMPTDNVLAYQVADFDYDGANELLVVKFTNNQLIYDMYEVEGNKVNLSSSVVAFEPEGIEEAAFDTFTTAEPSQGIFLQYYESVWHIGDGLAWVVEQYTYDSNEFVKQNNVEAIGSALHDKEIKEIKEQVQTLGLPSVDVWTSNMMCNQTSELNLLARVSISWTCDGDDFIKWFNGSKTGDFTIGEISIGGADVALPQQSASVYQTHAAESESHDVPSASGEYILPQSSSERISEADLQGFSAWDARLARNEILARHGRRFDTPKIQAYFDGCSWYNGTIAASDFNYGTLSKLEQDNVETIKAYESKLA